MPEINNINNIILLVNFSCETKEDVIERELPGAQYNDEDYSVIINGKTYYISQCKILNNPLDLCAYRLRELE